MSETALILCRRLRYYMSFQDIIARTTCS